MVSKFRVAGGLRSREISHLRMGSSPDRTGVIRLKRRGNLTNSDPRFSRESESLLVKCQVSHNLQQQYFLESHRDRRDAGDVHGVAIREQ